jgi:hypothetical protein
LTTTSILRNLSDMWWWWWRMIYNFYIMTFITIVNFFVTSRMTFRAWQCRQFCIYSKLWAWAMTEFNKRIKSWISWVGFYVFFFFNLGMHVANPLHSKWLLPLEKFDQISYGHNVPRRKAAACTKRQQNFKENESIPPP